MVVQAVMAVPLPFMLLFLLLVPSFISALQDPELVVEQVQKYELDFLLIIIISGHLRFSVANVRLDLKVHFSYKMNSIVTLSPNILLQSFLAENQTCT